MTVGEVVETLIALRDRVSLDWREDDAVCEACNILDELPNTENTYAVRDALRKEKEAKRNYII